MNALILADYGNVQDVAPRCRHHGLGIEVQAFFDPDLVDQGLEADALKHAVATHQAALSGIDLRTLHGPFAEFCPGSADAVVRETARQRYQYAYDVARQLVVTHIVVHHGSLGSASRSDDWVARNVAFWNDFLADKSPDVCFCVENVYEPDPALLSETIAAIDHPNVIVCLDTGHTHCFSKTPAPEWVKRLGSKIGYVHMHNNHGEMDEHLGLEEGTLSLQPVCEALLEHAPDAMWILEMPASKFDRSLQWLDEHGFYTS